MRILQVCKKFPYPLNDGERIAIHQLTKGLSAAGASVTVAALNTRKHFTDVANVTVPLSQVTYHSTYIDTTPSPLSFIASFLRGSSFNVDRFYSKDFEKVLTDILTRQTFDIIQLETVYPAIYLPVIKKHSRAKMVLRSHNLEHRIWERNSLQASSFIKKKLYAHFAARLKRFEQQTLSHIDAVIPISPIDAEWYKQQTFTGGIYIVPTGFDAPHNIAFHINQNLQLYYLGSMDWLPNVEGIIWFLNKVWNHIAQQIPGATLHLLRFNGDQPFQNLQGIQWYDRVEDVSAFIATKDILIVPLFAGSGIRIKIPEAMNYGKAVISTTIGAEGLKLTPNEEILIADSAEDFIRSINALHQNREQLRQLQHAGHAAVRSRFDTFSLAQNLLAYYRRLCQP